MAEVVKIEVQVVYHIDDDWICCSIADPEEAGGKDLARTSFPCVEAVAQIVAEAVRKRIAEVLRRRVPLGEGE